MMHEEDGWLLNEADPIHFAASEYRCAMRLLDDLDVPREPPDGLNRYSLVGRIQILCDGETRRRSSGNNSGTGIDNLRYKA